MTSAIADKQLQLTAYDGLLLIFVYITRPLQEEREYYHGAAITLVNYQLLPTVALHRTGPLSHPRQPPESPPRDHKSASS